ncbi:hypothetical protein HaLaN_03409 [Haematococcus lacustris]|uniref:Uncharacterized protein n=1 Tax=Haematococcus lacustris TaxID=44745 RepID=A0A699YGV5_HAELA|nr:hypothetical protein HaLaN_03409 [Haematococcus lacustris]
MDDGYTIFRLRVNVMSDVVSIPAWQGEQVQLTAVEFILVCGCRDVYLMGQPGQAIQLNLDGLCGRQVVWQVESPQGSLTFQGLVLQHLAIRRRGGRGGGVRLGMMLGDVSEGLWQATLSLSAGLWLMVVMVLEL